MKRLNQTELIGIDVGNHDTKSSNTTTPAGYAVMSKLPPDTEEYLCLNERYYIPTQERFAYKMDKTVDDSCMIFTLFGISKELLLGAREGDEKDIQKCIDGVKEVILGAGLPPAHHANLKSKTEDYYMRNLGNGVDYVYNGVHFNYRVKSASIFPQNYTAVMTNKKSYNLVLEYKDGIVYAIDIGGMTVDIIPIVKGKADMAKADSLELGTNKMDDAIIQKVLTETGHTIKPINIEQVLRGKNSVLPDFAKEMIEEAAKDWTDSIIDRLHTKGIDLWANPGVFLGGGSLLLKKYLKRNKAVTNCVFLDSPNANAKAYTMALKLKAS